MKKLLVSSAIILSLITYSSFVSADEHHQTETVNITTVPVTDNIFMLEGEGGNIGVLRGKDNLFVIDSQFAKLSPKIKMALSKISKKPIDFLLNTHYHMDHTDGNVNFANSGANIIAQENVRKKLKKGAEIKSLQATMPPAAEAALPILTFKDSIKLYEAPEELYLRHYPHAHTNGDTVVYFKKSNVIHTGDIYFARAYPFIDTENGGSVNGYLDAMGKIIEKADAKTKIIPGHGKLSDKATMQKDLGVLKEVVAIVRGAKKDGKAKDEITSMPEIMKYDADYGKGFIPTTKFVDIVFSEK